MLARGLAQKGAKLKAEEENLVEEKVEVQQEEVLIQRKEEVLQGRRRASGASHATPGRVARRQGEGGRGLGLTLRY